MTKKTELLFLTLFNGMNVSSLMLKLLVSSGNHGFALKNSFRNSLNLKSKRKRKEQKKKKRRKELKKKKRKKSRRLNLRKRKNLKRRKNKRVRKKLMSL